VLGRRQEVCTVEQSGNFWAPESGSAEHLVPLEEERRGNSDAHDLGGREVDAQLELRGLFHEAVSRLSTFQGFIHVCGNAPGRS
jgi:hypothetical protein